MNKKNEMNIYKLGNSFFEAGYDDYCKLIMLKITAIEERGEEGIPAIARVSVNVDNKDFWSMINFLALSFKEKTSDPDLKKKLEEVGDAIYQLTFSQEK